MRLITLLLILSLPFSLKAAEIRLDLNETTIHGSLELPKVTYVVPWREFGVDEAPNWPIERRVVDSLTPLDREVFSRYINYHHGIEDDTQKEHPSPK